MAFVLFMLPYIKAIESKKVFFSVVFFSLFIVLSHEYATVLMMIAVLGIVIDDILKREKCKASKILIAMLPATIVFLIMVINRINFSSLPAYTGTNVISAVKPNTSPFGLFFLANSNT